MPQLRKPEERKFNPKRTILSTPEYTRLKEKLKEKSAQLQYDGKPEHKLTPGDFNLRPPACGRSDKSLCDLVKIFTHKEALKLLREGFSKGLIDTRENKGWPRHIWAVTDGDIVLEGKPSMPGTGIYHGYPLFQSDPIFQEVIAQWKTR